MSERVVEITEGEDDLMKRVCQFAASRLSGPERVFQNAMWSKSLNCPVYLLIAFGDDAVRLQHTVSEKTQAPDSLIQRIGL